MLIHGTALDLSGAGLLILGASGSGKSDLALRLVQHGGLLVSDDQVEIAVVSGRLRAMPAPNIEGLIEGRAVGILKAPRIAATWLKLAVEVSQVAPERMPELARWSPPGTTGAEIPLLRLRPFEASAPVKLRLLLHGGANP